MNRQKTTKLHKNLRNTILIAAAVLVILSTGARAQQNLGDILKESGFDWLLGKWEATTDDGKKIQAYYKLELNNHLISMGFKSGDFEGRGMIVYVPSEDKVFQVGVDNKGGTVEGFWDADGDKAIAKLKYTRANGQTSRMAAVHSKADAKTMKVEFYKMDSDGKLAEKPSDTLEYKRQKKQAGKKEGDKSRKKQAGKKEGDKSRKKQKKAEFQPIQEFKVVR